jgi:CRISPR-associated endonuclease Csn1
MNKNIVELNNGKFHQPILKVRVYEKADKFAVGQIGNKKVKFVEAAKGTNLFFAIFEKNGKRSYLTIPLNVMIDCQKKYGNLWKQNIESYLKEKELAEKDVQLLFILSPNDLVYLPTEQNLEKKDQSMNKERIYKFVDCSGSIANFVPSDIAQAIFSMTKDDQNENFKGYRYGIQNEIGVGSRPSKSQNAITGEMIKETCIPIKVDRLGNIKSVGMMQKY